MLNFLLSCVNSCVIFVFPPHKVKENRAERERENFVFSFGGSLFTNFKFEELEYGKCRHLTMGEIKQFEGGL